MNKLDLKRLQTMELEILADFHKFCQERKLQYYLIGGALLGAVRYQSTIPWDDDIDVAMPREDYERLKVEFLSDNKYFLQNSDSDPLFARGIQKIRRSGRADFLLAFLLLQIGRSVKMIRKDRFWGAVSLGLTGMAMVMMFTNTQIVFTSPIDSYFLTVYMFVMPKYVGNAFRASTFTKSS